MPGWGKLLNLLNEFECRYIPTEKGNLRWAYTIDGFVYGQPGNYLDTNSSQLYLVSERYGFIDWLVSKELIDTHVLYKLEDSYRYVIKFDGLDFYRELSYRILMVLSISQNPIDDLINMLREDEGNEKPKTENG